GVPCRLTDHARHVRKQDRPRYAALFTKRREAPVIEHEDVDLRETAEQTRVRAVGVRKRELLSVPDLDRGRFQLESWSVSRDRVGRSLQRPRWNDLCWRETRSRGHSAAIHGRPGARARTRSELTPHAIEWPPSNRPSPRPERTMRKQCVGENLCAPNSPVTRCGTMA